MQSQPQTGIPQTQPPSKTSSSSDLHWAEAVKKVSPYTFIIKTPSGHGSGFLITTRKSGVRGIATAYHVISHAHEWGLPIKLVHHVTRQETLLPAHDRVVIIDPVRDVALIICSLSDDKSIPKESLELSPKGKYLLQGLSLGWLGFPAVKSDTLCFFEGKVSAWDKDSQAYFVDGVAINGVSGGPVFRATDSFVHILGCVSAYIPNRQAGESLPGLCVVQSITPFYTFLEGITSMEEARDKAIQAAKAPHPVTETEPPPSPLSSAAPQIPSG